MVSNKKNFSKRKVLGIIISVFSLIIISFVITKTVYDSTFKRYDVIKPIPQNVEYLTKERKEYLFKSGKNNLQGYLYGEGGEGLVVVAPGFNAGADEYLLQIKNFTDYGWGVFSFDATGSCRSEGESAVGFAQISKDLNSALDFVEQNERFGYNKIYLFGHSRGGWAVCSVLNEGYDIAAAVTVSGVNSCMDAIIQPVESKIGFLAYGNYPLLWVYQSILFGTDTLGKNSDEEIFKSEIPVLVVQGEQDEKFTLEEYSIYSNVAENKPQNVETFLCEKEGFNGHTSLLFGENNTENKELMKEINDFFKQNG